MGLLERLADLVGGDDDERLASDPLVLDTGTAGAAPVVPEADELTAQDLRARAEEFADRNEGAGLGFTLASLGALDDLAAERPTVLAHLDGAVETSDHPDVEPGGRVLDFGSYAGEVLVAEFDGGWVDERGWGVAVPLAEGPVTVPVFSLAARAVGGDRRFHDVGADLDAGAVPPAVDRPTVGVRTAMAAAAEEVAAYWDDYDLAFSPASLARLDALVDAEWDVERFRSARFGDRDSDSRVYTELVRHFGSYYGEVLVRRFDAEWTADPELGTVVDVAGRTSTAVANVFVVAANRLTDDERFALDVDVLAANLDLDAPPASEHGYEVVRSNPGALAAVRRQGPARAADRFEEAAATLAGEWPDYNLDYSPASLGRLDTLVAEEFAAFDLAGAELGGSTDADSLVLTTRAMEAGGYLAAVFDRRFDGQWQPDDLAYVVGGRAGEATLYPVGIAARCLRGEGSFAATYAAIDERLEPPGEEADDERSAAAARADGPAGSADGDVAADDGSDAGAESDEDGRAGKLAERWPAYDLDGSVESLARLDALVEAEFRRDGETGDDAGDGEDAVDPLALDEDDGVPERARPLGKYFAELLRSHHGATEGDDGTLRVEGTAGSATLSPAAVAAACVAGGTSFLEAYAQLAARAGLETPLQEG